jgi:hypothetical protein
MDDQFKSQSVQFDSEKLPHDAEEFGKVPQPSERFGNVPNASEAFRTVPKDSERYRSVSQRSERKENHTLTVREVTRMFEAAGVARTERSIVNWCQRDAQGFGKLDAYYDQNERRYFITPQSAEAAIAEEKAKAVKAGGEMIEPAKAVPKSSESVQEPKASAHHEEGSENWRLLEQDVMNLKILNGGKDFLIEQLRKEREGFIEHIVSGSRKIGQLETELRQLSAPRSSTEEKSPAHQELIEN